MNPIPNDELKTLLDSRGTCVSIYLPTHRRSPESEQDPIRWKNLIRDAEKQLQERKIRQLEIDQILGPARDLLTDGSFWVHRSEGLAGFITPEFTRTHRLPLTVEETVVVNDRFYLKPLLPFMQAARKFFVLAVSQNHIRLIEGSRNEAREIPLPDKTPKSLAELEAVRPELPEDQRQVHPGAKAGIPVLAAKGTAFHGYGPGTDDTEHKKDLEHFFHKVDKGVAESLRGRREPLVFAGVGYLFPLYKSANTYPHLLEETIDLKPGMSKPEELQAAGWKVVEPIFAQEIDRDIDRFGTLTAAGKGSVDVSEIVSAARQGRVDTLFVAVGEHCWGSAGGENGDFTVAVHPNRLPGDEDLLDRAALETRITGGRIHPVSRQKIPGGNQIAAVLRF